MNKCYNNLAMDNLYMKKEHSLEVELMGKYMKPWIRYMVEYWLLRLLNYHIIKNN